MSRTGLTSIFLRNACDSPHRSRAPWWLAALYLVVSILTSDIDPEHHPCPPPPLNGSILVEVQVCLPMMARASPILESVSTLTPAVSLGVSDQSTPAKHPLPIYHWCLAFQTAVVPAVVPLPNSVIFCDSLCTSLSGPAATFIGVCPLSLPVTILGIKSIWTCFV